MGFYKWCHISFCSLDFKAHNTFNPIAYILNTIKDFLKRKTLVLFLTNRFTENNQLYSMMGHILI